MAADPSAVFGRLLGLETEYLIGYRDPVDSGDSLGGTAPRPSNLQIYRAVIAAVRRRVPAADAIHFKEGVFTAAGGALWFETTRIQAACGLIEAATPECRSPAQLLLYSRAYDRLLTEAVSKLTLPGEVFLLKNDRDSQGNTYGAQENYEVTIARGWRLLLWRCGTVLLLPLVVLNSLGLLLVVLASVLYLALAGISYLLLRWLLSPSSRQRMVEVLLDRSADGMYIPPSWLQNVWLVCEFILALPAGVVIGLLYRTVAFSEQRRCLLPLLITRGVLSGAGLYEPQSGFCMADKVPGIDCVHGTGGLLLRHPIFNYGHLLKSVCGRIIPSLRDWRSLWNSRQRLQLGLGDSNMAPEAELLRIGTTLLVIDAIEAGYVSPLPTVRQPLATLRHVCRDTSFKAPVVYVNGRPWNALEVQHYYRAACEKFVNSRIETPQNAAMLAEARELLARWQEVLDRLSTNPRWLVGRLDWVTKRYLLEEAGRDAPEESLKKIDLRYSELSSEGYFQRLLPTGVVTLVPNETELDYAIRFPPANTPAAQRGRYIREFSAGGSTLKAAWSHLVWKAGGQRQTLQLSPQEPASEGGKSSG